MKFHNMLCKRLCISILLLLLLFVLKRKTKMSASSLYLIQWRSDSKLAGGAEIEPFSYEQKN